MQPGLIRLDPSHQLLNPAFIGYRLSSRSDEIISITSIPLSTPVNVSQHADAQTTSLQVLAYHASRNNIFSNGSFLDQLGNIRNLDNQIVATLANFQQGNLASIYQNIVCDSKSIFSPSPSPSSISPAVCFGSVEAVTGFSEPASILCGSRDARVIITCQIVSSTSLVMDSLDRPLFLLSIISLQLENLIPTLHGQIWSASRPIGYKVIGNRLLLISPNKYSVLVKKAVKDVEWSQDESSVQISLRRLDLSNQHDIVVVSFLDQMVVIKSGLDVELCTLHLYSEIDAENSRFDLTQDSILLTLKKSCPGTWITPFKEQQAKIDHNDVNNNNDENDDNNNDGDNGSNDNSDSSQKIEETVSDNLHEEDEVSYGSYNESQLQCFEFGSNVALVACSSKHNFIACGSLLSKEDTFDFGIQIGVDLAIFSFDPYHLTSKHLDTFDAFAYIQAGKEDRKFVDVVGNFALVIESFRRIYLYKRNAARTPNGEQFVIDLGLDAGRQKRPIELVGWYCTEHVHDSYIELVILSTMDIFRIKIKSCSSYWSI